MDGASTFADPEQPAAPGEDLRASYRSALRESRPEVLLEIQLALGLPDIDPAPRVLAEAIDNRLAAPRVADRILSGLPLAPRLALGLLGVWESVAWPAQSFRLALRCLGVDEAEALEPLIQTGLLASEGAATDDAGPATAPNGVPGRPSRFIAHPSALAAARTVAPAGESAAPVKSVRQVREPDGLEPILRLAALWQQIDSAPLRQTQQGHLFKRDRERLETDPALAGPISDAPAQLTDMLSLWLSLAQAVSLVVPHADEERLVAAPASFWADHSVHLPQMIATRWLALSDWNELRGQESPAGPRAGAMAAARLAALLRLSRGTDADWFAVDDLTRQLDEAAPGWQAAAIGDEAAPRTVAQGKKTRTRPHGSKKETQATSLLGSILLGPAYQLGLVRAAEEMTSGNPVVQLTPLGRYVLALGPPPEPRAAFDHFLVVQPNFEVVAYRQGLTTGLIGQLSRFARWAQLGAALELRLTPEAAYRGLEGGLTSEQMLDRLAKHSPRPIPASVAEALKTWAGRRERVSYHPAATLLEFATPDDREAALAAWPEGDGAPVRVGDRLLMVEDERSIPFHRFRLTGSRDYRRPPEACIEVEADGVTLGLDPSRSDLFVEAELVRVADELPRADRLAPGSLPRRRFRVSPDSLARASGDGSSAESLNRWFLRRTGAELPASIRLLLHASRPTAPRLRASRPWILSAPSADLIDGLYQHPETRDAFGERLGPNTAIVREQAVDGLRNALRKLGLTLELEPS